MQAQAHIEVTAFYHICKLQILYIFHLIFILQLYYTKYSTT
jgi:hypothetical protein